ncbi:MULTISPECIES: hypothetical protein [Paraburkholderia]|uniref:Uncharacterized protein n=1 Tax=Paraburkholderia podalyriae TaxID=1938811 RepID=A0ABR7PQN3_9BURK|nr:hypothetical protein [Paraburkholderia podalyriae]MBC8748535.1 hypothetical protein [Paraburkholderia podalyriae]
MADINSSAAQHESTDHLSDFANSLGLRGASNEALLGWVCSRFKVLEQQIHIAASVARGGSARASAVDGMGDPFDSTSAGIFDAIIQTLEDSTVQNEMHAGLAELRRAATERDITGTA